MRRPGLSRFMAANPDLLDSRILKNWYSSKRLTSEAARRQFLLPDRPGSAADQQIASG